MSPDEKQQRILEIQSVKEELLESSRIANTRKIAAYNGYLKLNKRWVALKNNYEILDREEKLLDFSLKNHPAAKTKLLKKKKSSSKKSTEAKAKEALTALSPEQLARLLKDYKS
jgi:hypothetical protein